MTSIRSLKDRQSRSKRRIETFLHRQDGREIRALLTDVSNHGCRLQPQEWLAVDERVRIEVPRLGSIAATIRWMSGGHAGAEFVPQSDVWEEAAKGRE